MAKPSRALALGGDTLPGPADDDRAVTEPIVRCPGLREVARTDGRGLEKLFPPALTRQTAILSAGFRQCGPCKEIRGRLHSAILGHFLRGFGRKRRQRRDFQQAILLRLHNHIIAEIAVRRLQF